MRKTAFLSTFVVLLTLSLSNLSAQAYTYIRYDANTMDRLDHQFLGTNSAALYTSYRLNKNTGEQIFLDIGIESPVIHKSEPPSMVSWQNANIDQNFVMGINNGQRKVFICKKLDSGWAVQAIGSGVYMSNIDRVLTVVTANYDFRADLKQALGNNLSMNTHGLPSPTSVFYVGELQACNTIGQTFKVFPSETNKFETTITVLPGLGIIRENAEACPTYELVGINGKDVCSYLGGSASPAAIQPEPIPETYSMVRPYVQTEPIPESYVNQPYIPVETGDVGEVYVRSKTIVENNNITKSDHFGETRLDFPQTYNNAPANIPQGYNTIARVPQTVIQTEKPIPAKVDCSVTALAGEHVVQSGENLYSISRRYGLSVNSLREWNNMSSDILYPCGILKIAAPAAPAAVETVAKPSMEVARTNDVPMSYNTVVKVTPKKVEAPVITKVIECEVPYTDGEHVVLHGENLYAIARKYNVTYADLKSWNKLKTDVIKPCQKLIVAAPKSEIKTVSKVVATKTTTVVTPKSVDVPKQYNEVVKPKTATTSTVYIKTGAGLHVVLNGETVYQLAKQFNMTEAEFRKINFLSENEGLAIGQVVRTENCNCTISESEDHTLTLKPEPVRNDIPASYNNYIGSKTGTNAVVAKGTNRKYHVVQSSETLYTIAKNYGKSMEELRKLNNLNENEVIIPNQMIVLE